MTLASIGPAIEDKLSILIRQPLIDIGRASNLLWLSFGERISTLDRKGNEIQKGKYALNVQCAWRLTQNSQIIVASKDFKKIMSYDITKNQTCIEIHFCVDNYDFDSFEKFISTKVFYGKSLKEIWNSVSLISIDASDIQECLQFYLG